MGACICRAVFTPLGATHRDLTPTIPFVNVIRHATNTLPPSDVMNRDDNANASKTACLRSNTRLSIIALLSFRVQQRLIETVLW